MKSHKRESKNDTGFKVLFENDTVILGYVFEVAYCYNKLTDEENLVYEFDNDPNCGLVGQNNDWCLVGGNVLVLKTCSDNNLRVIDELKEIFDLKLIDAYNIQILTDPWLDNAAIWLLSINLHNLQPITLTKVIGCRLCRQTIYRRGCVVVRIFWNSLVLRVR